MKVLLRALYEDGKEVLGTEYNYIKECKSLSSLMTTNAYKAARRNVDQGLVHSYRVEEFTYGDNARVHFTINNTKRGK